MLGAFDIGHELGEGIATVKVSCIPLAPIFKGLGRTSGGFSAGDFHEGHSLRSDFLAAIGFIDILEHNLHRCAVNDDVMIVQEQVIMTLVVQHTNMEQATAIDIKGFDQAALFLLDVLDLLDGE